MNRAGALPGLLRGLGRRPLSITTTPLSKLSAAIPRYAAPRWLDARPTLIPSSRPAQCRFQSSEPERPSPYVNEVTRGTKKATESKPDLQTYLFSNHVLDLGADGTPGVREFDEADREIQEEKWSRPREADVAARERLTRYIEDANEAKRAYEALTDDASADHWRIRDIDILQTALGGGSASTLPSPVGQSAKLSSTSPMQEAPLPGVAPLLRRNGIPYVVWEDDATLLGWMVARQVRNKPRRPAVLAPGRNGLGSLIGGQPHLDFADTRRVLSAALTSGNGLGGLEHFQGQIYKTWFAGRDRPVELQADYDALVFINDLSDALQMGGYDLSDELCYVALEHAAQGLYPDAVSRYLSVAMEGFLKRQTPPAAYATAIRRTLMGLARGLRTLDWPHPAPPADFPPRGEFLRILTGAGGHYPHTRHPINRAMEYEEARRAAYPLYIQLLARLGALRTLWHEWRRTMAFVGRDSGDEYARLQKAQIFLCALLDSSGAVAQYRLEKSDLPERFDVSVTLDQKSMPSRIGPARPASFADAAAATRQGPEVLLHLIKLFGEPRDESVRKIRALVDQTSKEHQNKQG